MSDLKEIAWNAIQSMEGWCTRDRAELLIDTILERRPLVIVEIGVFGGRSIIPQGLACRYTGRGTVYGIDPWVVTAAIEGEMEDENRKWWGNDVPLERIHQLCMEAIWRNQLEKWVIPIRARSEHVFQLFDGQAIDMLSIDGNHSALASCRDVLNYLPRVRTGGMVFFDDADWNTTKPAMAQLGQTCHLIKDYGSYRLYQKIT